MTRNAIEMFVAAASRCCLDEGSDTMRRETACALMRSAIHPSIALAKHMWIPARGQPHQTATTGEGQKQNDDARMSCLLQF